jgi:hypothetical protein
MRSVTGGVEYVYDVLRDTPLPQNERARLRCQFTKSTNCPIALGYRDSLLNTLIFGLGSRFCGASARPVLASRVVIRAALLSGDYGDSLLNPQTCL